MDFGAAIVLAAGGSRRMGAPKPLLPWRGQPLVAAHALALAACCDRVVVVVGAGADAVRAALPAGVLVVENPRWEGTAPSDSARLGAAAAGPVARLLVTPVDVAPATADGLRRLAEVAGAAVPVGPDGREGHPVVLGPDEVAALLSGRPLPDGLRGLLVGAGRVAWPTLPGDDFDTPADFEAAVARAEGGDR